MGPFANELPITYHFVWLKGQETRPNVRAFRNWLFSEMGHTVAQWAALTIAPG
jgi:DNA-binding transcriptional LysR family regulator